jgi:hypothetical protein
MTRPAGSNVIDQLVSSYFELPVRIHWKKATGLPFPDRFEEARLEFAGIATAWMDLKQVIWRAHHVRFVPGMPAKVQVTEPRVEIAVGKAELGRWLKRFQLPYRLELTEDAIVIHTELAGFPVAELEARLEVVGGWFVLQPRRATILGMPNYVASLFRTYLPLPPLAGNTQLEAIRHEPELLRLTFALEDFEEQVTPGLLARLQKRLLPTLELPFAGVSPGGRTIRPAGSD